MKVFCQTRISNLLNSFHNSIIKLYVSNKELSGKLVKIDDSSFSVIGYDNNKTDGCIIREAIVFQVSWIIFISFPDDSDLAIYLDGKVPYIPI